VDAHRRLARRSLLTSAAALGLGLVAAACGAPPAAPATPAGGAQAPATSAPAAAGATPAAATGGQKIKIAISHIGGGSLEGSEKSDRMKQLRANFPQYEIENRWMSYAAYVDKISLITSTGDLADLQFCNAFNDVPLMMENNLLLETGPLLEQHGKAILAATPKEAWDSTLYEGKQYAVAHNIYDLNIWTLMYRKDWLEKAGKKVPETLDEYTDVLKALSKDPGGTGKPTFGRALFNSIKFDDDIFHAFDVAVGHHANGFWRQRNGKLELDWVQPGMKEAWAWLRARWAEKVFEPDSVTQQITYKGQVWNAGVIGSQYGAWTAIDSSQLEIRKVDPKAELVAGPAPKGPNGAQGYTGEGFPWVYVIPKKSQVAEHAVRLIDWFFQPKQAARFTCEGELDYTLKGLNEKGYCIEYTTQEKIAMGAEWNDRVNRSQDIVAYGGLWLPLGGNAIRPWLLNTMPADMKAHFEGVLKARYSPAALQGMDFAMKYVKTTGKKRPTKSEKQYWPGLQTRFLETITQVVAGTLPLEQGWNDWLAYFQKNGGPVLTQEVNEIK
jgi:ABC-type glycerol-3-phosphate transport system substrate-binding protein